MWPAFPASDYYGPSVPSRRHQPATGLPTCRPGRAAGRDQQDGSHVHSRIVRRDRRPAMPLQPRHGYAADLHHGLPTGETYRPRSSPPPRVRVRAATQPRSARFELVGLLRDVQPLVPHVRLPSCLPDPDHLAVLARPVVVRAAFRPPPRPRDQAALSFTGPLRRAGSGVLSPPHDSRTPRGAPTPSPRRPSLV
jgi:hypothetical protein